MKENKIAKFNIKKILLWVFIIATILFIVSLILAFSYTYRKETTTEYDTLYSCDTNSMSGLQEIVENNYKRKLYDTELYVIEITYDIESENLWDSAVLYYYEYVSSWRHNGTSRIVRFYFDYIDGTHVLLTESKKYYGESYNLPIPILSFGGALGETIINYDLNMILKEKHEDENFQGSKYKAQMCYVDEINFYGIKEDIETQETKLDYIDRIILRDE